MKYVLLNLVIGVGMVGAIVAGLHGFPNTGLVLLSLGMVSLTELVRCSPALAEFKVVRRVLLAFTLIAVFGIVAIAIERVFNT